MLEAQVEEAKSRLFHMEAIKQVQYLFLLIEFNKYTRTVYIVKYYSSSVKHEISCS